MIKQAELMSSNIEPELKAYDFHAKTKPLLAAEDSRYGADERNDI